MGARSGWPRGRLVLMGGDSTTGGARARPPIPPELVELHAARALLRARTEADVVEAVLEAVRALGGEAEPVTSGRARTLPIDLTFGTDEPLLPAGPPEVLDRLRGAVPPIVEDARIAMDRARRDTHLQETAWADVLTGLVTRPRLEEVLERLGPGDTVACLRLDGHREAVERLGAEGAQALVGSFGRFLRRHVHAADTVGRLGPHTFGVLLLRTDLDAALELVAGLRSRWLGRRGRPLGLTTAVAAVAHHKPARVLSAAEDGLEDQGTSGLDLVIELDPA